MRAPRPCWVLRLSVAATLASTSGGAISQALPVSASPPTDVSVTLYRDPYRRSDSLDSDSDPDSDPDPTLDLDRLGGFALVTETRTVTIPAGVSRLRFEGVADGIQPDSALITGLPRDMLEKNHDARVLSPSALVAATVGRKAWLVRTDPKTGKTAQVSGTLVSDTDGVIFQGSEGIEALRCSGLPETFHFEGTGDAAASPTLSALVSTPTPITTQVRLSYLADGFDWMATYTATVSPDRKTMDLGAWVTLANGNAVSFPQAHTQVVAGRLNRESGEVEPVDQGAEILAKCWPRGSTSDTPEEPHIERATPLVGPFLVVVAGARKETPMAAMSAPVLQDVVVTGVKQEQLGDLKLYRVPERTSVSSRQIKQVRLLDRRHIPVELIYSADLPANVDTEAFALKKTLRTRNDKAHHLDLPLPSGRVAAFYESAGVPLLVKEGPLRDVAVNEEFEIDVGDAPDVEVTSAVQTIEMDPKTVKQLPLIPGAVHLRASEIDEVNGILVSNARSTPVSVELRLQLPDGAQLIRADHDLTRRNGHPAFQLSIPAGDKVTIRYQTEHTVFRPVPR
jgi:hypothetical protein